MFVVCLWAGACRKKAGHIHAPNTYHLHNFRGHQAQGLRRRILYFPRDRTISCQSCQRILSPGLSWRAILTTFLNSELSARRSSVSMPWVNRFFFASPGSCFLVCQPGCQLSFVPHSMQLWPCGRGTRNFRLLFVASRSRAKTPLAAYHHI